MKYLTDKEYVLKCGLQCPVCGSGSIEGSSVEIDGGHAWQELKCRTCDSIWNDIYLLTGYDNLVDGRALFTVGEINELVQSVLAGWSEHLLPEYKDKERVKAYQLAKNYLSRMEAL